MKKKILLAAFAVALIVGSIIGTVAYAQMQHQPPRGNKLVGVGWCAQAEGDTATEHWVFGTMLNILNPNCSEAIDIKWVSIIDMNGNSVFEGAPGTYYPNNNPPGPPVWVVPQTLGPHEVWQFYLENWIVNPPQFEWEGQTPVFEYTVEITWGGRVARSLAGEATHYVLQLQLDETGNTILQRDFTSNEVQMVNY